MKEVYIVFGSIDYEGSEPLRAFASKDSAESFKGELVGYENVRPPYGIDDETRAKHEDWEDKHPSGRGAFDSYYIETMGLHK